MMRGLQPIGRFIFKPTLGNQEDGHSMEWLVEDEIEERGL
jgi:hypothetical protein